jgi:single-stranded DNA-specific DHH superfamily exonuclease
MENWKKYWIKFAIGATVNASIFVGYRLYIHKLNKQNKQKDRISSEKNIDIKNQEDKSLINSKRKLINKISSKEKLSVGNKNKKKFKK